MALALKIIGIWKVMLNVSSFILPNELSFATTELLQILSKIKWHVLLNPPASLENELTMMAFSVQAATTYDTPVLVIGAGPAGMLLALQLARNGVRSMLIERNLTTTKWPKMDVTNCRSMELFNRLGISQGLRRQGKSRCPRCPLKRRGFCDS